MLAAGVQRGDVVRLRRGVYVAASQVPDDPVLRHVMCAEAEQVADPRLIVAHESAALAWQLPLAEPTQAAEEAPTLIGPRDSSLRSERTRTARILTVPLPAHHVDVLGAVRLTSRARTAVDVAAGRTLPVALITLDAAARAVCLDRPGVRGRRDLANPGLQVLAQDQLREAAATGGLLTPGLARILAVVDPRRETPIESLSAGHMHQAGIPAPVPQEQIHTAHGTFYPDFVWRERRLIGEADGAGKYRDAQDMLDEKAREQVLRDAGFDFVRWTGREIWRTPDAVMDRIWRALRRAN